MTHPSSFWTACVTVTLGSAWVRMLNEWQNERIKAWLRYKAETLKRSNRDKCLRDEWGECGRARKRVGTLPSGRMPAVLELCVTTRTPCQKGFPLTHLNSHTHTHTPFTHQNQPTLWTRHTLATYKTRNIFNLLKVHLHHTLSLCPQITCLFTFMWKPKSLSISSHLKVVFSAFTRGIPEEITKASGSDVF